ncbi:MAG: sigma-70 family RNA polymerase sigma factor [Gemmatimonadetes bacterium]|nr:sigma-70 family RNA polymerase sigma factor [Gemmatimonadota bacterium]
MGEDLDLVRRCKEGDQKAFRVLVERYEGRVYNLACSILGDREIARDAAQTAFIRAYQALPRFRADSAFYTWLYRIAVNVCLNAAQKEKRRRDSTSLDTLLDSGHFSTEHLWEHRTPAGDFERLRLQETIQEVLNLISPDHRLVIVLKDIEGMSQEEISWTLNCSVGTVKSRLSRARAHLRDLLRPVYNEWKEGTSP